MKLSLGILIGGAMLGVLAFGGGAHAQTAVTADQMIGAQTRIQFDAALDRLQVTLNDLRAKLNSGNEPASPAGVDNNLERIEGTLAAMRSTLLAFDAQARILALGGTPGLPNTGGGGTAEK